MLNLNTVLEVGDIAEVQKYTVLRLKRSYKLRTPEALALYEQRYLPENKIKELCEEVYGYSLYEPLSNYIPEEIVTKFRGSNMVPVAYLSMSRTVYAVYLPEYPPNPEFELQNYSISSSPTTLYYYLEHYQKLYGTHAMLQEVPCALIFQNIVQEAIKLGAADITLFTVGNRSRVYYNVRKRIVNSNCIFSADVMQDIITYLCIKSPYSWGTREPKYVDIDLTKNFRGRVVINSKYKGYTITIRVLPNKAFEEDIDNLNLTENTSKWLKENLLDNVVGLRLIVGETMSGKNTTALALLKRLVSYENCKIISVEMPVEQELPGIEQITTETLKEYSSNIKSLIHQNPDFVYITEIRDITGIDTLQITNTGKRVLSTIHANSIADTISRLIDITGLSIDRVLQTLHTIVYQKLIRDEEKDIVYPRNRYIRFTEELKYQLYGKSLGEVLKIIKEKEEGDYELLQI